MTGQAWDLGVPRPMWKAWPTAPKLVVNDACAANNWTPTTGTNPTLGTGGATEGEVVELGETVVARCRIQFGTAATNAGSGAYRVSLPYPVVDSWRAERAVLGTGQLYNDTVAAATFGIGPTAYRGVNLHTAETLLDGSVSGIVLASNLALSGLQTPYTRTNHSDLRTMDENAITLPNLAHVVGTMQADLETMLSQNVGDNVGHAVPWAWGANFRLSLLMIYKRAV